MTLPQRRTYRSDSDSSCESCEDTQSLLQERIDSVYDQLAVGSGAKSSKTTLDIPTHYRNHPMWIHLDENSLKTLQWGRPEKVDNNNGISLEQTLEQERENIMMTLMEEKENQGKEGVQQCMECVMKTTTEMASLYQKTKDIWTETGEETDLEAFWAPYGKQHLHQCIKLLKDHSTAPVKKGGNYLEMNPLRKKQRMHMRNANRDTLRTWFADHFHHPYPRNNEKKQLSRSTGLTVTQVNNWFINTRVREWKPHVRAMAEAKNKGESKQFEAILSRFKQNSQ